MPFTWTERPPVRNPEAEFRVNTIGRTLAPALDTEPEQIWWLVLIRPAVENSILGLEDWAKIEGLSDHLEIPGEYSSEQRSDFDPGILSIYARRALIEAFNDPEKRNTGVDEFEVGAAFRKGELLFSEGPFLQEADAEDLIRVGQEAVVVAVIDHGMAIGHELFRGPFDDGAPTTRVAFYWDMNGAVPGDEASSTGAKWTRQALNARLKANFHNGLLDDTGFYAAIGAADWSQQWHVPTAHRLSHGTHVMGLCAGYAPDCPTGVDRPIIAVNLRSFDVRDPSGSQLELRLADALDYIISRHERFRVGKTDTRPPLVINFSFGNYAGPHDGTGIIEEKIADALDHLDMGDAPFQFILPDGNGNQSRCHAALRLAPGGPEQTLSWRVQPGDRSASGIQVWLDCPGEVPPDHVTLTVTGPGGIPPVSVDCSLAAPIMSLEDETGAVVGSLFFLPAPDKERRGSFRILLTATDDPDDVGPFAPAGCWQISLAAGPGAAEVGVKAWILRDHDLPGFPGSRRQSYFDLPSYSRFYEPGVDADPLDQRLIGGPLGYDPVSPLSPVRRSGTLSGFTTGSGPIVVGGFVGSTARMALYSASGPTNAVARTGPDASARSDDSAVLGGVVSAGSASGSMVAMPGTSVAAPQICRWVADQMASGQPAGRNQVRDAAIAMDPSPGNKPPVKRSGGGRMVGLPVLFGKKRWQKPPDPGP